MTSVNGCALGGGGKGWKFPCVRAVYRGPKGSSRVSLFPAPLCLPAPFCLSKNMPRISARLFICGRSGSRPPCGVKPGHPDSSRVLGRLDVALLWPRYATETVAMILVGWQLSNLCCFLGRVSKGSSYHPIHIHFFLCETTLRGFDYLSNFLFFTKKTGLIMSLKLLKSLL